MPLVFLLSFLLLTSTLLATSPQPEHLRLLITGDTKGLLAHQYRNRNQGWLYLAEDLVPQPTEPHTLRLDVGDTLGGSDLTHYLAHELNPPEFPLLDLLNELQWDAMVLGNADLSLGPQRLRDARKRAQFPMLAGNVRVNDPAWPDLPTWSIVERGPLRIGLFGLTTPGAVLWHQETLQGLYIEDPVESARKWVDVLRNEHQVDLVIALLHSGEDASFEEEEQRFAGLPSVNAAGLIANHVRGIDLVISGHDHRTWPRQAHSTLSRYPTPLVSPGAYGTGWLQVDWTLERQETQWLISESRYQFHEVSQALQPRWRSWLRWQSAADQYMATPLPFRWNQTPSRIQWNACLTELLTAALPTPQKALLPEARGFSGSAPLPGQMLERRHLHRWWPYRNHLQLARLLPAQIDWLRSQPRWYSLGLTSTVLAPLEVWLTDYHLQGNQGVYQALIASEQLGKRDTFSLPERLFAFLATKPALPESCGFLQPVALR